MRISLVPAAAAALVSVLLVSCKKAASSASATPDPVKEEVEALGLEYVCLDAGLEVVGEEGSKSVPVESWADASDVQWWVDSETGEGWIPDPACSGNREEEAGPDAQNAPADTSDEGTPETKSYFNSNVIYWKGTDVIKVYDDGYGDGHDFTVLSGGGTATAKLSGGVCQGCRTLYCVSPSSAGKGFKFDNGGTVTVTVPSTQKITSGQYCCADAVVAAAKITRAANGALPNSAQFKNVCCFIRFNVTASNVTKLTLTSLNNEYLAGTVPLTWGSGMSIGTVSSGSLTITVNPASTNFETGKQYVVAVLGKSSMAGLAYSYTMGGTTYYGKMTFDTNLSRSRGQDLGTLNGKGATAMTALSATVNSMTQITVGWTNKSTSAFPLKYQISYGPAGTTADAGNKKTVDNTNVFTVGTVTEAISGLSAGTEYSFYIRTLNRNGTAISGWSAATNQMTKLDAPTGVTVTGLTATTYRVSWTAPASGSAQKYYVTTTSGTNQSNITATSVDITAASRNATGISVTVKAQRSGTYADTAHESATTAGTGRCGYFSGGAGTSGSAFQISSEADLRDLMSFTSNSFSSPYSEYPAANTNATATGTAFRASYYKQTANIGTTGTYMEFDEYIGHSETYPFSGVYDGQNNSVTYYDITNTNYVGLFGAVVGGTVKNLKCSYFRPHHNGDDRNYQGAVVGNLKGGTVDNCHYTAGAITFTTPIAGGIVGRAYNTSTVRNCSCKASITAAGQYSGGIVGQARATTLQNCYTQGCTVSSAYNCIGGIAGYVLDDSTVTGCYCSNVTVTCNMTASNNIAVGGIAGYLKQSTMTSCYFDKGTVQNINNNKGGVGGMVGKLVGATVNSCHLDSASGAITVKNKGTSTAGDMVGGIVGQITCDSDGIGCTVTNCYVKGNDSNAITIQGRNTVGGIVGNYTLSDAKSDGSSIHRIVNCWVHNSSNTTIEGTGSGVAGILGGTREGDDNSNNRGYRLLIDQCYVQNQPQIKGASASGYESGTACMLGTATAVANNTAIYVTNCVIGSADLQDSTNGEVHMGGLVGIFKVDINDVSASLWMLNCASYVTGYYASNGASNTVCVGSALGCMRVKDNATNKATLRLHALSTDFLYTYVYKSAIGTKTKKYNSAPAATDCTAIAFGIVMNYDKFASDGVTCTNIVAPTGTWTQAWCRYHKANNAWSKPGASTTWVYAKSGTDLETALTGLNSINFNDSYKKKFTAKTWVKKGGDNNDDRPYLSRNVSNYRWESVEQW